MHLVQAGEALPVLEGPVQLPVAPLALPLLPALLLLPLSLPLPPQATAREPNKPRATNTEEKSDFPIP